MPTDTSATSELNTPYRETFLEMPSRPEDNEPGDKYDESDDTDINMLVSDTDDVRELIRKAGIFRRSYMLYGEVAQ